MESRFDIVVPTHNNREVLARLLSSLERQTMQAFTCCIVDDASQDDTVEMVADRYPWARVIRREHNRGPAENRNLAAQHGTSPYLVFFDDDAYVSDPEWLTKAWAIMEATPSVGQLATLIVAADDDSVLIDCGIQNFNGLDAGGIYHRKRTDEVFGRHLQRRLVLGACTAGTVVRRDVFQQVGGFDPKYFYLAEDADLSLRIILAGYDVLYEPALVTRHEESQAMGRRPTLKHYLYRRNSVILLMQNYPRRYIAYQLARHAARGAARTMLGLTQVTLGRRAGDEVLLEVVQRLRVPLGVAWRGPSILRRRRAAARFLRRPRSYLLELRDRVERDIELRLPVRSVIYEITNVCNGRCPMCFLRDELNKPADLLSLDEIRLLFRSMPEVNNVVLGGGEPFLRADLPRIVRILVEECEDPAITIPTNGSQPATIEAYVRQMLETGCRLLVISLSLDGLAAYHDRNRGIPGLFEKVQETYDRLRQLPALRAGRLLLQVNTCVTKESYDQLDGLFEHVATCMPLAQWVFEPVRGSYDRESATGLTLSEWEELQGRIERYQRQHPLHAVKMLRHCFHYAIESQRQQTQAIPCAGGDEILAIDYRGNIRPCEILSGRVNVRDLDYDVNRLTAHPAWRESLRAIKAKECHCTHFCWLSYSIDKRRTERDPLRPLKSAVKTAIRKTRELTSG